MKITISEILRYLALIMVSTILTNCNDHKIKENKVYYTYWNEGNGSNWVLVKDADAKTFKEIKDHPKYSIDKRHVYYKDKILRDADPETFIAILDYYGKDKYFAYEGAMKIIGVDADSFT